MAINSFKDLIVWQKSMDIIPNIYKITRELPLEERYGLASQLQRASLSIPSNIAEGSKRSGRSDFRHFCLVALGSAAEVETQLLVIKKLYPSIPTDDAINEIVDIQKMLSSLTKNLRLSKV